MSTRFLSLSCSIQIITMDQGGEDPAIFSSCLFSATPPLFCLLPQPSSLLWLGKGTMYFLLWQALHATRSAVASARLGVTESR